MKQNRIIKLIKKYKEETASWLGLLLLIISLAGLISKISPNNKFFSFLYDHSLTFLITAIFLFLAYLYFNIYRIDKKLKVVFIEKLNKDLHENWDFNGDWQIENGQLSVTSSEQGGISKIGALWENYEFSFETKILNSCSAWIVRAEDINNYFMFQINLKNIRPHQRLSQPIIKRVTNEKGEESLEVGEVRIAWKLFGDFPHYKNIKSRWFKVKTIVKGSRVDIYINGNNVYHQDNLLINSTGRVGFRNSGDEHAHFRNIKVNMID